MCTAMKIGGLCGRTLDLEYTYGERVVSCPRDFTLALRHLPPLTHHHAILGTATVAEGFPLYYDAVNEHGLAMAALHFPHSGVYAAEGDVASFELIPYVLGQCANAGEAKALLQSVTVCDTAFSDAYPPTRLHWMVADATAAMVAEPTREGLEVYDNPVGVLTNEPPFPDQLRQWAEYAHLTAYEPTETPPHLGRGSGGVGLPGDFTSPSRFARAAFVAAHSEASDDPVGQFFEAMAAVTVPRGCLRLADGGRVTSRYTACMDLERKVYYFRLYGQQRLHAVGMTEPQGDALATYPLPTCDSVAWQN